MANRAQRLSLAILLILASLAVSLTQCGKEKPTGPKNTAPDTPSSPSGPATGVTDTLYQFSSSATDPDGDKVAIRFAWGDGDTSGWSSFVSSGEVVSMTHAWDSTGTYYVRAQAKNSRGAISGWSASHQIVMPTPAPGSLKWTYDTGDGVISSPAISSDGTIYVGSYNHNLYAINPDGSLKWTYNTGHDVISSPAIGSDGAIYVGSDDGNVYAINPDGSLKWTYNTGGMVESSPAIGSDGTIYVGSRDGKLYAIQGTGTLASSPWPMFRHDLRHSGRSGGP